MAGGPGAGARVASLLAVAPLHAEPTRCSEQVSEVLLGEPLTVVAREDARNGDAWLRVTGPDAYTGWLPGSHVACVADDWPGTGAVRVGALGGIVTAPDGTPLRRVVLGCRLAAAPGATVETLPVRLPDGTEGRIARSLTQPFYGASVPPAERLEAMAETLLGIPYRWGGRSPGGLDCSGLVQLVAAELGVGLPRDTDLMEAWLEGRGARVDAATRERGDIVLWGTAARATHVGIALDGERFLHAREWVRIGRWSTGPDADLAGRLRGVYRLSPAP